MLLTLTVLTCVGRAAADEPKTWIPPLKLGEKASIEVYGQINKGFLVYDDGGGALLYPVIDNSNSSTRLGLKVRAPIEQGLTLGGNLEYEWTPYASDTVNRSNRDDPEFGFGEVGLLRELEVWGQSTDFGKLSIGQGSMASDSTAEVDLSGTNVVAYSKVDDLAGGQFLRTGDGPSTVQVKSVFDNLDGLSRLLRARYDTPSFAGFTAAASIGTTVVPQKQNDKNWDVALRYNQQLGDYKVAGAVAYSWAGGKDQDKIDGSASVRHRSGWSGTLAAGHRRDDSSGETADYVYGKLGYATSFFDVGETAFSVDLYRGHDFSTEDSDSRSFGVATVQRLDYYRTELFLAFRLYDYSEPGKNYDDGWGVMTGARISF